MRKTALVLMIIICFALTACNGNDGAESASTPSQSGQTSSTQTAPASGDPSDEQSSQPDASASPETADALGEDTNDSQEDQTEASPSATTSESEQKDDASSDEDDTLADTLAIQSHFPMQGNVHLVYEGTGMEYAGYECYVEYLTGGFRGGVIQYREINDGTDIVAVYVNEDGMLKRVVQEENRDYRVNLLDTRNTEEILLKTPLETGNSWTAKEGVTRTITATDMDVTVPLGTYQAIEVTVTGSDYTQKEYYAEGQGLIKTEYYYGDSDQPLAVSALSVLEFEVPYTDIVTLYFGDFQSESAFSLKYAIDFFTNDNPGAVIGEAMKQAPDSSALAAAVPYDAAILSSSYNENTGVVTIDLSENFISEMNAGSQAETNKLTYIARTFIDYYGADHASVTVNGNAYESGHYSFGEGDYLPTDIDDLVVLDEVYYDYGDYVGVMH